MSRRRGTQHRRRPPSRTRATSSPAEVESAFLAGVPIFTDRHGVDHVLHDGHELAELLRHECPICRGEEVDQWPDE